MSSFRVVIVGNRVISGRSQDRAIGVVSTQFRARFHRLDLQRSVRAVPGLQAVFSESYLGWIPFVLEHCDLHWERHFTWAVDHTIVPRRPSEYFQQNLSVCLVYDRFGATQIEHIGVDRVLAEADYPHPDSQWPNT